MNSTQTILEKAKAAKPLLSGISDERINAALTAMADALIKSTDSILSANTEDIKRAEGNISPVMID